MFLLNSRLLYVPSLLCFVSNESFLVKVGNSPNSLPVGVLAVVPSSWDLQKVVPAGRSGAVPEQSSLRSSQPET